MKRIVCLLLTFVLAISLAACGTSQCPDDVVTELLSADKTESGREVTVTSVKVNSHELEDNDDTITASMEYENPYATFTSELRAGVRYFQENREWRLIDVYEENLTAVEPKVLPTAEEVTALFDADREQWFAMMGLCQEGLLDTKNPLMLDIGFTVGEPTRVDTDPTQPMLSVPLDVEGQQSGWFTTHGTIELQLSFDPDNGNWEIADVKPGSDFSMDCVLANRSYASDSVEAGMKPGVGTVVMVYEMTLGDFDWTTLSFTGDCTYTQKNLTEGTEKTYDIAGLVKVGYDSNWIDGATFEVYVEDTLIGFMMVDDDGQDLIQDMRNYTLHLQAG